MHKREKTPKIICNKVKKRFLNYSESVALGLEPEPSLSDFTIKKELGKGSFGSVFLAMHKKTKANYAVKAIDKRNKTNEDGKPYFRREIEIMYKLRHPNIVRLFGNFEDENFCYFVMEYIPKGNLYNLIKENKNNGLDKILVAKIMRDLINAIHYLHSLNPPIIHRDIKPENILLTNDNKIKLTDFGWANYINYEDEQRSTFCGTPLYLAPEMIDKNGHGKEVDIWCLGVLLFELLVGVPPFTGKTKIDLIKNIMKIHILWPKFPKKDIDKDAKDLIIKILKVDPKQRITLEEMVKHPFFIKNIPEYPSYLENAPFTNNKPYIISKDIPSDDNNFIIAKRINISKSKKKLIDPKLIDSKCNHISPRLYIKGKKNIFNKQSNNNINNYDDTKKENTYEDGDKNHLIYNKSAIDFFPKVKPYKKKGYNNNDQNKDNLLKIIEEYEKKDKEKNKKMEELLQKNKILQENNLLLNEQLKEKEEELLQKEKKIKLLESQLLFKKLMPKNNKKVLKNKNIKNNNNYYENDYDDNSYDKKDNCQSSRTPEVSPIKYNKKDMITNSNSKPYMKKYLMMNNNNDINNKDSKDSSHQYDLAITSTNISSIDNKEIEKLKNEFIKEKEKHEKDIDDFTREIRLLQIENKNIKEKNKSEIIKLTRHLTENEKEMKKYRAKVKELEIKMYNKNKNNNGDDDEYSDY